MNNKTINQSPTLERWGIFAIVSAIFFFITGSTFTSRGVVLPYMVEDLSWSWTNAGLGFTLLALLTGLASMLPAWTLRMFGIKAAASGPKPAVINVPAPGGALHANARLYSYPH